ncbi:MAG: sensor signal transduction histidine kinase [Streptosporangiaceae bacterium]|nr:sensor signal transduction histidine kinase [Streptosporangiaceae bacterium]
MGTGERPGENRARLVLPQMRLDDLLDELRTRLETVLATRDRVHTLLETVVSIGSDLDLETVLFRITEAGTTLADARYGTLAVISDDGEHLVRLVTVGATEEEIAAIGHWPQGLGILGLLVKDPCAVRLGDLSAHVDSHGLPADHPPMRRFLGVPIRVRDKHFGNLYLTEKTDGGEFDEEDEVVIAALATAAGVAIENARLYQEACRRERWLQASAEISTALLSGTSPEDVVGLVARRAREICDADLATVALVRPGTRELRLSAADGAHAGALRGLCLSIDDAASASVYRTGTPLLLEDGREAASNAGIPGDVPVGPTLIVSLGHGGTARGVLAVVNEPGRPVFDDATLGLLEPFAAQAAVALELAERRADTERLALLEDRDRIAKDLHDTVIQRLFATAMTLMSAVEVTDKPDVARRIQRSVDDLDATIRQIRSTIFALQADPEDESLRSRLYSIVDAATAGLGFAPSVRLDGLLDTAVCADAADHLLAVLREALSNIGRHAKAHQVRVSVDVGDQLVLRVEDDGIGIPATGRRSGLRNIGERAESLGGSFAADAGDEGGTVLVWRIPLR